MISPTGIFRRRTKLVLRILVWQWLTQAFVVVCKIEHRAAQPVSWRGPYRQVIVDFDASGAEVFLHLPFLCWPSVEGHAHIHAGTWRRPGEAVMAIVCGKDRDTHNGDKLKTIGKN